MINKADVMERLSLLMGKELNSSTLHEGLFCEGKHQKVLRRFHLGKQTYVEYKLHLKENGDSYADILVLGNPNTFRLGVEEKEGKVVINSIPRISYTYLSN
jgi:hypothetical protein